MQQISWIKFLYDIFIKKNTIKRSETLFPYNNLTKLLFDVFANNSVTSSSSVYEKILIVNELKFQTIFYEIKLTIFFDQACKRGLISLILFATIYSR